MLPKRPGHQISLRSSGPRSAAPTWLPFRASTFLDFQNGRYYTAGSEVVLSAVVNRPSAVTVDAGLVLVQGEPVAKIIGDAAVDLLRMNWTVFLNIDWGAGASATGYRFVIVNGNADSIEFSYTGGKSGSNVNSAVGEYNASGAYRNTPGNNVAYNRNTNVVITRTDKKLLLAQNGGTVDVGIGEPAAGEVISMMGVTDVVLGNYQANGTIVGGGFTLKALTVLPPQLDALLSGLSA